MSMKSIVSAICLATLLAAVSASAETRVYTQSGDTAGFSYFPEGYWSTGNKTFVAGDDVTFLPGAALYDIARYIAVTNAHTTFGALATTNLDVTLEFAEWRAGDGTVTFAKTLADWNGLMWFFRPDTVSFSESTVLKRLRASGRVNLAPAAGKKLVVSNLVGRGTIKVAATGAEVEFVRTSGDLAGLHLKGGDITLHGDANETAAIDVEKVLARSMIHLDAQNAASLTIEGGKVSRWSDPVSGAYALQMKKTGYPYQSYIDIPLPAYVADYNGSGKPVVDFGPYASTSRTDFATCGAACLRFRKGSSELRDNANHVFIVFADNDDRCLATPFNDSYNPTFQRATDTPGTVRNYGQTRLSTIGALARYGYMARTGRDGAYNGYPVQSMFQFGSKFLKIAEMDYRRKDNSVPTGEKRVGALARTNFEYWGGVVVGEVIVFSESVSLTDAERTAINDYLRKKWLPASEQKKIALNELHYSANSTVSVPTDGTARVRHLVADRDTFAKDGAGTLLIGDTTRPNAAVTVKDGAFGFAARTAVTDSAPARGARHHFDADAAADSIETETDADGVVRVTRWNDEDADHPYAEPITVNDIGTRKTTAGADIVLSKPKLVENMLNGRRGVSMGPGRNLTYLQNGNYTNAAAMRYGGTLRLTGDVMGRDGDFREGFAVVKFTAQDLYYVFGTDCSAQNMHNMGNDHTWAHPDALGASVSWNGVPLDLTGGYAALLYQFGVIRFSCGDAQPINTIGLDRYTPGSIGGVDVCEYITYDRILTDAERIDTEAYLMKKWLNKEHPLKATPRLAAVNFADGKTARVVAESDAAMDSVTTPDGNLTKSGEGLLAAGVHPEQLTGTLAVEAGQLVLSNRTLAATLEKACFHVDASLTSSILTNADGEVLRWDDVRGVSVFYATNWVDWPSAKPVVAAADCNGRDTINFGTYRFANGDGIGWSKQEAKDACAKVTDGSGLKWKSEVQLVESYEIFTLNAGGDNSHAPVVGSPSHCNFHPDGTYILNRNGQNAHYDLKNNSLMMIDDTTFNPLGGDEAKWATYNPTQRYLMYGFAVTNKTQATYPYGGAFAYERHQGAGGMRMAEGVYFAQALTEAERAAVIAYLRHKWQVGVADNVLEPACVRVAQGASLTIGGLAFAADGYSFAISPDGDVTPLNVEASLTLKDNTIITLTAAEGFRLAEGVNERCVTLITAEAITYGENIQLVVDAALAHRHVVTLIQNDDTVQILIKRKGLALFVR